MIYAGIESGAKNSKAIIMDEDRIIGKGRTQTGFDQKADYEKAMEQALQEANVSKEQIEVVGATGSGKESVEIAHPVNDISAMAKGAIYFFPSARTAVDIGGKDGRAAKIDEKGQVLDFVINEKCVAAAGEFIELMANTLGVDIEQMGPMALESNKKIPINAQCAVFAEFEARNLLQAQTDKKDISKAVHNALAGRIISILRRIGIYREVILLGGLALNSGFIEAVRKELDLDKVLIPDIPEYGSAIGAALAAKDYA